MVAWKNWFTSPTIPSPRVSVRPRKAATPRWRYIEAMEERMMMAGAASQLVFTVQPSSSAVGTPMFPSIQVSIEDFQGQVVTTDTSNVTLTLSTNPPGGGFAGGSTITVKAVNGVANFTNVSFTTVGSYSISAIDGTLVTSLPSNVFTITPAAAKLAFIQQPTSLVAGSLFTPSITVQVQDANGNLVSTDRSNITLSIATGTGGTITGTTTIAAVNGVATFNGISFPKTGTFRIQAKDGSLTGATSNSFTVSAAAAAGLSFGQQPTNTPGSAVVSPAPVVYVLDSFGNIVTSDASTVTLSIASGPNGGTMAGTTSVVATNGVATFSNISFPTFGLYTLQAADGSLNAITSNSFAVTGPPTQLAFLQQPTQTTINSVINPSIVVLVEDAGGNVVANDTSPVTISIATGAGSISGTTTVNAVNGIATFNDITLSVRGTYTLAVADGALTNATSNPFLINGLPTQLAFTTQPIGGAAGDPLPSAVVVTVQDSAGSTVVTDNSLVVITLNGTSGGLSGTTTLSAVHGVATFTSLIPTTVGTFTLSAADGALVGATSSSFIVTPSASQVVITQQPVNVAATSVAPSIIVQVRNSDGNVVTTNTSNVTLAIVSGPSNGSISGTSTVAAVAGIATFSNLSFTVPGTYQLVAFDGSLATDTSNLFTVTGPPAKITFLNQPPSSIVAGHSMSGLIVAVRDSNGNIISTDSSTVTLSGSRFSNGTNPSTTSITAIAINGIATFPDLVPLLAGTNFRFTASDGALTSASTNTYSVTPDIGTAHFKVVSTPPTSLVGKKFTANIVLNIVDQFDNVITTDNSQVLLTKSAGPGTLSGTLNVKASKGVVTFSNVIASQAGDYTLLATDTHLFNSTISFNITITPAITTIPNPKLSNPYTFGKTITLTDTIKSLVSTPIGFTGVTTLLDAADNVLASGTVTSSGATKFVVTNFTGGNYTLHIRYAGDNNHTGGTSADFNLTVGPAATTTTITPSATNLAFGQTVSISTLINTFAGATIPRSGTVIIRDNGVPIPSGTVTLSSSAASLSFIPAVGTHKYSILYSGDTNYKTSLSLISTIKVT